MRFFLPVSAMLILFSFFVTIVHIAALGKQAKTEVSVTVKQTVTDQLANIQEVASIAYASLKPFSSKELQTPCVVKAERMIGQLANITRDALQAQIVYDQDPDSESGKVAEANIRDANFEATVLKKVILPVTQKCAKTVAGQRLAIAEAEQKSIERLEKKAREVAKKKFNATMFPNPIKREERQKAFLRAADMKAKAERELHEMGKGSEYPLTPRFRNNEAPGGRVEGGRKTRRRIYKGTTSAEEFGLARG